MRIDQRSGHRKTARFAAAGMFLLFASALPAAPWVVITEIHYHPPDEEDQFIEVMSREPPRVDLADWTLSGEVEYRFPAGTVLRTGESVVIARSPEVFRRRRS